MNLEAITKERCIDLIRMIGRLKDGPSSRFKEVVEPHAQLAREVQDLCRDAGRNHPNFAWNVGYKLDREAAYGWAQILAGRNGLGRFQYNVGMTGYTGRQAWYADFFFIPQSAPDGTPDIFGHGFRLFGVRDPEVAMGYAVMGAAVCAAYYLANIDKPDVESIWPDLSAIAAGEAESGLEGIGDKKEESLCC